MGDPLIVHLNLQLIFKLPFLGMGYEKLTEVNSQTRLKDVIRLHISRTHLD